MVGCLLPKAPEDWTHSGTLRAPRQPPERAKRPGVRLPSAAFTDQPSDLPRHPIIQPPGRRFPFSPGLPAGQAGEKAGMRAGVASSRRDSIPPFPSGRIPGFSSIKSTISIKMAHWNPSGIGLEVGAPAHGWPAGSSPITHHWPPTSALPLFDHEHFNEFATAHQFEAIVLQFSLQSLTDCFRVRRNLLPTFHVG